MVEIVKYAATGRRKSSVARVTISPGTGKIRVNKRDLINYFPSEIHQITIMEPLQLTNADKNFDVTVRVTGGGNTGQAGALRLGLARALVKYEQGNKPVLKKALLLRRDPRMKERQKPGQKGARKKFQWVKR